MKSSAVVAPEPSASARKVAARSAALTPVVVPSRTSTVTVKAVPLGQVLESTMGGRSSASAVAAGMGAHRMPVEWRRTKATLAGVAWRAARRRSPSFSRSSSSMTTTRPPSLSALTASSIVENEICVGSLIFCVLCCVVRRVWLALVVAVWCTSVWWR
jgi:hypothetical protein